MDSQGVLEAFLFTDLVDSTQLKQRLGDVLAAKIIGWNDDALRDGLKRYGGQGGPRGIPSVFRSTNLLYPLCTNGEKARW